MHMPFHVPVQCKCWFMPLYNARARFMCLYNANAGSCPRTKHMPFHVPVQCKCWSMPLYNARAVSYACKMQMLVHAPVQCTCHFLCLYIVNAGACPCTMPAPVFHVQYTPVKLLDNAHAASKRHVHAHAWQASNVVPARLHDCSGSSPTHPTTCHYCRRGHMQ